MPVFNTVMARAAVASKAVKTSGCAAAVFTRALRVSTGDWTTVGIRAFSRRDPQVQAVAIRATLGGTYGKSV